MSQAWIYLTFRVCQPAAPCPGPEPLVATEQVVVGGEAVIATHHRQVLSAPEEVPQTAVAQGKPGTAHTLRAGGGAAGGEGGGVQHGPHGRAQSQGVRDLLLLLLRLLSPLGREDAASQQERQK